MSDRNGYIRTITVDTHTHTDDDTDDDLIFYSIDKIALVAIVFGSAQTRRHAYRKFR